MTKILTILGPPGAVQMGVSGPRMAGGVGITRESAQAQHLAKWEADEPLGNIFIIIHPCLIYILDCGVVKYSLIAWELVSQMLLTK